MLLGVVLFFFFFFKQKTAYEMRISDWSSDVCSSDLDRRGRRGEAQMGFQPGFARRQHAGDEAAEAGITRADGIGNHDGERRLLEHRLAAEIGRASCRERVCQYV